MKGRTKTPSGVKALQSGKRPVLDVPPLLVAPDPPLGLSDRGREIWRAKLPRLIELRIVSECDLDAFETLCWTSAMWEKTSAEASAADVTVTNARGNVSVNPALNVAHKYATLKASYEEKFGLTPGSRGKVGATSAPAAESELDKFNEEEPGDDS